VQAALDQDVPAPITALSLFQRFASRQEESYAAKVIAALRQEFGGHAVLPEEDPARPERGQAGGSSGSPGHSG
jgi:6-phosphogluconate dehydrogenase